MTPRAFPPDLLARCPEEAARLIALRYLDDAVAARARLDDGSDAAALHDFRVAIRRLRSSLRAYRDALGGAASKKMRRALRALAADTGMSRDAEMQCAWLTRWRADLTPYRRVGCDWLLERLATRQRESVAEVRRAAGGRFAEIERRLRRRLRTYVRAVPGYEATPGAEFRMALARIVRRQTAVLGEALRQVAAPSDELKAHRARIETKRLRYLLEPVASAIDGVPALVQRLKNLQQVLGDWHDLDLLAHEVAEGLEVAAAQRERRLHAAALLPPGAHEGRRAIRAHERPGLLALARMIQETRAAVFASFAAAWIGGSADAFLAQVVALTNGLDTRAPDVEIERKYLLRGAPAAVRGVVAIEIEQGWLPGRRLRERVRASRGPEGERYYRTIKSGAGIQRLELEEEITPEVFQGLWPLTAGRRLRKRRYVMPAGALAWEIDEFLDRDLWLAEVELPARDTPVELPDWLAGDVVREVTEEPEYLNYNLAS